MTQNVDYTNLQELKEQFSLISKKLEKQSIINEKIIKESMKTTISGIENWYRMRFRICTIAVPLLTVLFFFKHIHWGFILLMDAIAIIELLLNNKCYKALDLKNLFNLSMTAASENIVKHKQLRALTNKILFVPMLALIVWTILIASGYSWNPSIIILSTTLIAVSAFWGITLEKANKKKLEDLLQQIRTLKE